MKIYLASRYSRYLEMQRIAVELESMGHVVTSRWIKGDHQISDEGLSAEARAVERTRFATEDFSDLMAADMCISFTEEPRSTNSRGGRHVEFGIALAHDMSCHIVGPRENVFHCLPQVAHWKTWEECVESLRPSSKHIMKTQTGIERIAAERARQIAVEGWTPEHDDQHVCGEMAQAAACYALGRDCEHLGYDASINCSYSIVSALWPWDYSWFKTSPDNRRRDLVKAGALIAAEIDRLNRLEKNGNWIDVKGKEDTVLEPGTYEVETKFGIEAGSTKCAVTVKEFCSDIAIRVRQITRF